ncbi:hypothetical protein SAMN05920897_10425 [Alkalispirochaeta americana]|uniref:Uncharacterized protein n=1 Tax=Alkalispirochaeta americana TaxID=159291 RepID=A0A1N6Q6F2_9SPIO|nr:hypothetical protein [Alkalispirochaeta americana]SIQ12026.1 hypothetical protein SAMN05920897_10425 [Alkalispirochaeta americana]
MEQIDTAFFPLEDPPGTPWGVNPPGSAPPAGGERYHLNWPGRIEALRRSRESTDRVLRPRREESFLFDQARNMVIQEEPLGAFKMLQESLLEQVAVISLSLPAPPAEPERQGQNHSAWLSEAYPLFRLAWNLLQDRGLLRVVLPPGEEIPLLCVLDELFGEEQRLFSWGEGAGPGRTVRYCKNAAAGTTAESPWQDRQGCFLALADPEDPLKTMEEVLARNGQDQGQRSFVLIVPPEDSGHPEDSGLLEQVRALEIPFRLLRGDSATREIPCVQDDDELQQDLPLQIDRIKPGRTPEDLLFHALLSCGISPGIPLERQVLAGGTLFCAGHNRLVAWFGHTLTDRILKEILRRRPGVAVFRESACAGNEEKQALERFLRESSPGTVAGYL